MDCNRVKSRSLPLTCVTAGGESVAVLAFGVEARIGFVVEFDIPIIRASPWSFRSVSGRFDSD